VSEFAGLNALITGGSSGIGAAVVRELTARGAHIVILDVVPPLDDSPTEHVQCDVGDSASVEAAMSVVGASFDRLDVLVNSAAIAAQGTVRDNTEEEWARVLNINVTGIARVSRAALPLLERSNNPAIVNIASIAATAGLPQRALYSASKGAVLALTRAMAADHLAAGVRVNCVSPGTADTPWVARLLSSAEDPEAARAALEARQPHGRLVTAAEVADAVLYLASPRSGSTTGHSLAVDGGMSGLRLPPTQ
jgi:NAD(P)-dependent dehydrogenase (short-subunit alcohol dehydrogenase family)